MAPTKMFAVAGFAVGMLLLGYFQGESMARTFEDAAENTHVHLQALSKTMAHTFGEHFASANVKFQAFANKVDTHYKVASDRLAESVTAEKVSEFGVRVHEKVVKLKDWLLSDEPKHFAKQFLSSTISTWNAFRSSLPKAWDAFRAGLPKDAASFKTWCQQGASLLRERFQTSPMAELGALAICLVLSMVILKVIFKVLAKCFKAILCCRRRTVEPLLQPAAEANAPQVHEALMPLREKHVQSRASLRRRSDTPPPPMKPRNGAADKPENADLIWQINNGSAADLSSIPGLGSKSVDKILNYRSRKGELESLDDLVMKVGLKPVWYGQFKKSHSLD